MSNLLVSPLFDSIWKKYAPAYSKVLPSISFYAESADMMVESVDGHHYILDLGCGPGIIAERLAKKGHKVLGVDNDETMINYAKQRLKNFHNVRIEQQDANSLPFDNGAFDGIVCNNLLYYVENPEHVLEEACRVLKDEGIFSVSGPTKGYNPQILFEKMETDIKEKGLSAKFSDEIETIKSCNLILAARGIRNPFHNHELETLLKKMGFSEIITSKLIYLNQCYFISANKGHLNETDLLKHDIVKNNVIISKKVEIPEEFDKIIDGYKIGVAKTPEEMAEVFKLRYKKYTEKNLYESEPLLAPYDFDKFDKNSAIVYAKEIASGKIVGTVRLILDSDEGLYTEETYDYSHLRTPERKLAETSRWVMLPSGIRIKDSKHQEHRLGDVVYNFATEFARHIGVTHIVGLARLNLKYLFERHGYEPLNGSVEVINLHDGKINSEEPLYPVICDTYKNSQVSYELDYVNK